MVLLRGLVAVAFGVLALAGPRVTLSRLALLFGVYALAHGILSVAAAIGSRGQRGCLLLGIEGVIALWAGTMTLKSSHPTPMAFVFLVWLWAIATGLLKIAEAIRLRKVIPGDIWWRGDGISRPHAFLAEDHWRSSGTGIADRHTRCDLGCVRDSPRLGTANSAAR